MRDFKFFQKGTLDNPQMLYEETYTTASLNDDTPNGQLNMSNEEILRLRYESIERELVNETNHIPFFTGGPRVTRVNPKWWMKIKMFFQKIKINAVIETHSEAMGIFFIAITVTFIFGLMIAKVLNIW